MDMNGFALGALFLQPVKSQIRNTLRYDQTSLAETSPNSTECVFFYGRITDCKGICFLYKITIAMLVYTRAKDNYIQYSCSHLRWAGFVKPLRYISEEESRVLIP